VEGLVVDRAFLDDRARSALELTTIGDLDAAGLAAPHIVQNILAASALARSLGVEPEAIHAALGAFQLDAHRIQVIARHAGVTKWNYWRLGNLAVEGITSFSTAPLRIATWLGVSAALLAFLYGLWVLLKVWLWGDQVRGYPTLMVVILFLGGAQLLALGVIGEYIGRTYAESKRRPLYYVESRRGQARSPGRDPTGQPPA
jgi:hypothetical protein